MHPNSPLRRAAEILRQRASVREVDHHFGYWDLPHDILDSETAHMQRDRDEMLALAAELDTLAGER